MSIRSPLSRVRPTLRSAIRPTAFRVDEDSSGIDAPLTDRPQSGHIMVTSDGKILIVYSIGFQAFPGRLLCFRWSADGGATWNTPAGASGGSGSQTAGPDTFTVPGAGWTTDQWRGAMVETNGKFMAVASNTADTITGLIPWTPTEPGDGQPWSITFPRMVMYDGGSTDFDIATACVQVGDTLYGGASYSTQRMRAFKIVYSGGVFTWTVGPEIDRAHGSIHPNAAWDSVNSLLIYGDEGSIPNTYFGTADAAVSAGANTLVDTRAPFVTNEYQHTQVSCDGKTMLIESNTTTTLTGFANWVGGTPANELAYTIQGGAIAILSIDPTTLAEVARQSVPCSNSTIFLLPTTTGNEFLAVINENTGTNVNVWPVTVGAATIDLGAEEILALAPGGIDQWFSAGYDTDGKPVLIGRFGASVAEAQVWKRQNVNDWERIDDASPTGVCDFVFDTGPSPAGTPRLAAIINGIGESGPSYLTLRAGTGWEPYQIPTYLARTGRLENDKLYVLHNYNYGTTTVLDFEVFSPDWPEIPDYITPSPVVIASVIPAPTISFTLAPSPVVIASAIAAPVLVAGPVSLAPDPVVIPSVVATPVTTYVITPDSVAIVSVVETPAVVAGPVALTPDPVAIISVVETLGINYNIAPDPVAIVSVVGIPSLTTYAQPDPVAALFNVPAPAINYGINPDSMVIVAVLVAPALTSVAILTPDPVVIASVVVAPVLTAGSVTLTPSPVEVLFIIPVPVAGYVIQPTSIEVGTNLPAPTLDVVLYPSPVEMPTVIPDPVIGNVIVATPNPVVITSVIVAPVLSVTLNPAAALATFVVPDPTIEAVSVIAPDPVVIASEVASPTVGLFLLPNPVVMASVLPSPQIDVALLPIPVEIVSVIAAPTVGAVSVITPDPVVITSVIATPGINVALLPSPVVIGTAIPDPAVLGTQIMTPDPVVIASNIPTPSTSGVQYTTPSPVVITSIVPDPVVSAGAVALTPDPVVMTLTPVGPAVSYAVTPSPVVIQSQIATPQINVALLPTPVVMTLMPEAPTVGEVMVITPSPVPVATSIPTPTVTMLYTIAPASVSIVTSVVTPLVGYATTPDPVVIQTVIPAPGLSSTGTDILLPDPVVLTFIVPNVIAATTVAKKLKMSKSGRLNVTILDYTLEMSKSFRVKDKTS